MHEPVFHLDHARLDAEFLVPHPVRKHADPRPQRCVAERIEFNLQNLDAQHVARLCAEHFDGAGGAIHEGQGDVFQRQLLSQMPDRSIIDVDRRFDPENLSGRDLRDEGLVARKGVFDVSGLGDAHRRSSAQSWTPRVNAPSTTRFVPVMKLAAGLARNTAALAISCGVPMRPVGLSSSARL